MHSAASRRTARWIRAVLLWGEGKSRKDVATATGLSLSSVYRLIRKFQDNGVAGISEKRRHRPFAAPKYQFTAQQKAMIEAMRGLVADKRAARKLEALWLRTEKKNLPEISTITGPHTQTVYDVIRKYHERGWKPLSGISGADRLKNILLCLLHPTLQKKIIYGKTGNNPTKN